MAHERGQSEQNALNKAFSDPAQSFNTVVRGFDGTNYPAISVDSDGKLNVDIDMATEGIATSAKQDTQITQVTNVTHDNLHTTNKELRTYSEGHVCAENSTNVPLGISGVFSGAWQDTLDYSEIIVSIGTDKASITDGLKIYWSMDGISIDGDDVFTISANADKTFTFPCQRRYVKVDYHNDGVAQTRMALSTLLKRYASKGSSHRLADNLNMEDDAIATKSMIAGFTTAGGGGIVNVKVNPSGALTADVTSNSQFVATEATALKIAEEWVLYGTTDTGSVTYVTQYLQGTSTWITSKIDFSTGLTTYATVANNATITTPTLAFTGSATLTYGIL